MNTINERPLPRMRTIKETAAETQLQPYASALEDNLFEVKEFVNEKTGFTSTQTLITPKGRETFRLLMIL